MASTSPSPNSPLSAVPPAISISPPPPDPTTAPSPPPPPPPPDPTTAPPPPPPPPDPTTAPSPPPPQPSPAPPPDPLPASPPPQSNASSPDTPRTPSTLSPSPPTPAQSPPPSAPPPSSPPSPQVPTTAPPPSTPPPPPNPDPPTSPPPPEPVTPPSPASPVTPPPSPSPPSQPVGSSPPPPSNPSPSSSPPPPTPKPPPRGAPPPSPSKPPESSPPPKSPSSPPKSSPPPSTPPAIPPEKSPPPPKSMPRPPPAPLIKSPPPPQPGPTPPLTPPVLPPPTSPQSPPSPTFSISPPPPPANSPTMSPPTSPSGNGGMGTAGAVAIAVAVGIIILSIIGFAVCCMRKRRRKVPGPNGVYVMPSPSSSTPTTDSAAIKIHSSAPLIGSSSGSDVVISPKQPSGIGHSRSWFEYEELIKATDGFSDENLLGEGGFGSVYKGCLPDGRLVAVKQLRVGGKQGEREFKAEVEIISRIHHRHLVSLVGYCIAYSRRLLVYDYVPNNTLYFHLHGADRPVLDWATRVKIAAGAARGIAYLHEDCHPRVIHRDIKSSNILLDSNFEARVSDFGLAKLAFDADSHITTRVMGTFGYMAPEYATSGKLTEKSDVYSYGVVLLELITGRKPVDASQPLGDESLVEWARPLLSHALETEEFESLADPRLERNYIDSEMFRMIEAAAACVRHAAAKRPRMGQIVRAFDSLATADLMNGMRLGESEVYDSAEQSAEIRLFRRMAFGSQNYSTGFFSRSSSSSQNTTR